MWWKLFLALTIIIGLSYGYDEPTITTQHQNILRSFGNLGQISSYSKTLDTPFSSVRKADVRISNPGLTIATPYAHTVGLPTISHSIGLAQPVVLPTLPAISTLHSPYSALQGGYPLLGPKTLLPSVIGPSVAKNLVPNALGVAFSPSTAVSHMAFTNGLGLSYGW